MAAVAASAPPPPPAAASVGVMGWLAWGVERLAAAIGLSWRRS
jgi:hypothetical protein